MLMGRDEIMPRSTPWRMQPSSRGWKEGGHPPRDKMSASSAASRRTNKTARPVHGGSVTDGARVVQRGLEAMLYKYHEQPPGEVQKRIVLQTIMVEEGADDAALQVHSVHTCVATAVTVCRVQGHVAVAVSDMDGSMYEVVQGRWTWFLPTER